MFRMGVPCCNTEIFGMWFELIMVKQRNQPMKMTMFMLCDHNEESERLYKLLTEDFTIISFFKKDEAFDFIRNYSNWFDAAIISSSALDGNENDFIKELIQKNPEMAFGILVETHDYFKKMTENKLRKVNYLPRPIEDRSVNIFVSVARMINKYQMSLN